MTFTTSYFPIFLLASICMYYLLAKSAKAQNILLIISALFFYGMGHPRYLLIWACISSIAFLAGLLSQRYQNYSKTITVLSVVSIVMVFLGLKYPLMISQAITSEKNSIAAYLSSWLPIGLSFYSFTTIGYVLDVKSKRIEACKNPITFYAYCGFFPQLLSGPISFADKQLPQFSELRTFDLQRTKSAIHIFLWGVFKKVVISGLLSKPIAYIFAQQEYQNSTTLFIGLVLYSIQIYADFSGYSDMAFALGKAYGIQIPNNFNMPYFANNIAEYWRRWHSSLSMWFSRYVYVPMGGNKKGISIQLLNLLTVFLLSGLWHGADWKFVLWGAINGLFFIIYILSTRLSIKTTFSTLSPVKNSIGISGMLLTFLAVSMARVYFRADSIESANSYLLNLFDNQQPFSLQSLIGWKEVLIASLFIGFEWWRRNGNEVLHLENKSPILQYSLYALVIGLIAISFLQAQTTEHIYFKF